MASTPPMVGIRRSMRIDVHADPLGQPDGLGAVAGLADDLEARHRR